MRDRQPGSLHGSTTIECFTYCAPPHPPFTRVTMFYQTRFAAQPPVCGMQGLGLTDTLGSFVTGTVQMETGLCAIIAP